MALTPLSIRGQNTLIRDDTSAGSFSAPSKFEQQVTRGIPTSSRSKVTYKTINTQVMPMTGQPTETINDTATDESFAIDTYRNGAPGYGGELSIPRQLGDEEDNLASMTLTAGNENIISAYSRFFLESVSEGEQEKYQIVETFTSFYVFFYGKRPPVYRFAGTLLNDPNYRWNNDMKFMYENYFRGTRAVEFQAQVVMSYDSRIVTGFPLSLTMNQNAMNDKGIPFAMDVLVTDHIPVNFSKDIAALLEAKSQQLKELRDRANRNLAKINSNVPSAQTNLARLVTNGLLPSSSTATEGKVEAPQPTSYKFGDPDLTNQRNSAEGTETMVSPIVTSK